MRAILVVLAMVGAMASASAAECGRWTAAGLISHVPYFDKRMEPAGAAQPGVVALVHRDDPAIAATFRLEAVEPTGPVTRAAYIADLQRRVDAAARQTEAREGVVVNSAVFPYDPITATSIARKKGDSDVVGETVMRMSAECQLRISWTSSETASMVSRNTEFRSALDALRILTASNADKGQFAPDRYVPAGWPALAIGVGIPLALMIVVLGVLQATIQMIAPQLGPRIAAAALMGVAIWAFQSQLPIYFESFRNLAYLDSAVLLLTMIGFSAAAAVSGAYMSTLLSLASAVVFGFAFAVQWALGWSADGSVSGVIAGAFIGFGVVGLAIWQVQASIEAKRIAERVA